MQEIVYAFIDSQNLNIGVRSQNWKIDYKKFRMLLADKFNVQRAFLFIGYIAANESLYDSLRNAGFEIVHKPVVEPSEEAIKKYEDSIDNDENHRHRNSEAPKIKGNVDADMVLHSMIEINNYDKAVVVTGDGDFYGLIEYLSGQNKLLKIIVPNQKYSTLLHEFGHYIVPITVYKKNIQERSDRRYPKSKVKSLVEISPEPSPLSRPDNDYAPHITHDRDTHPKAIENDYKHFVFKPKEILEESRIPELAKYKLPKKNNRPEKQTKRSNKVNSISSLHQVASAISVASNKPAVTSLFG